jgi:hypothetical protein
MMIQIQLLGTHLHQDEPDHRSSGIELQIFNDMFMFGKDVKTKQGLKSSSAQNFYFARYMDTMAYINVSAPEPFHSDVHIFDESKTHHIYIYFLCLGSQTPPPSLRDILAYSPQKGWPTKRNQREAVKK